MEPKDTEEEDTSGFKTHTIHVIRIISLTIRHASLKQVFQNLDKQH